MVPTESWYRIKRRVRFQLFIVFILKNCKDIKEVTKKNYIMILRQLPRFNENKLMPLLKARIIAGDACIFKLAALHISTEKVKQKITQSQRTGVCYQLS